MNSAYLLTYLANVGLHRSGSCTAQHKASFCLTESTHALMGLQSLESTMDEITRLLSLHLRAGRSNGNPS